MKREEKILLAMFIVVLAGALWVLAFGQRERTATVQFTDATWAADGHFRMGYNATQTDGTVLRDIVSVGGSNNIGFLGGVPASLFRKRASGSGDESSYLAKDAATNPSLLVKTGITYTVTLTNSLVLYDFTNSQGTHYKRQFQLSTYRSK